MNRKHNRETPFRFPFDIDTRYFLVLAFVFFTLSIKSVQQALTGFNNPQKIADKIETRLNHEVQIFHELLSDTSLISQWGRSGLSDSAFTEIHQLPFQLFVFLEDSLIFWNHRESPVPEPWFDQDKPTPYHDSLGHYIAWQHPVRLKTGNGVILALFRVKYEPIVQNKFFVPHFPGLDPNNDYNLAVSTKENDQSIPIKIGGKPVYYVSRHDQFLLLNDRGGWRIFLCAVPFILFGVSIHTFFKVEVKKRSIPLIFSLLLLTVLIVRGLTYFTGFPNDFDGFGLFSPLYFATDPINRSLGDLFINMCLLFWILLFFIINVQGKVFDLRNSRFKLPIGILIQGIVTGALVYLANLIYRITRDSVIHLDTTLFYKLDVFSFIGLLSFMVIFVNVLFVSIISWNYLHMSVSKRWLRYLLIILPGFLSFFLANITELKFAYLCVFSGNLCLFYLQDRKILKTKFDFNSYKLLGLMILVSAGGAIMLTVLIQQREFNYREQYGQSLLSKKNLLGKESVKTTLTRYLADDQTINLIRSMKGWYKPEVTSESLTESLQEFQVNLMISSYDSIADKDVYEMVAGKQVHFVFSYTQIPGLQKGEHLLVNLDKHHTQATNSYLDLLKPQRFQELDDERYTYGIYVDSTLVDYKGIIPYPNRLGHNLLHLEPGSRRVFPRPGGTDLWLSDQSGNAVVITKSDNGFFLFTTLFAYIFFIYFITISLYILGNIIARSNLQYKRFVNLLGINLRLKIQGAILLVVLGSFIVIGYFTSYYLIDRVKQKAQLEMNKYVSGIQEELRFQAGGKSTARQTDGYDETIRRIGERMSLNLNIYDISTGRLQHSTYPELFQTGLLSDCIHPHIWRELSHGKEDVFFEDQLGLMSFLNCLAVLRNIEGQPIAIMELPFFLTSEEVRSETFQVITTLINVYIFVFLVSAVIALFITRRVTKDFDTIVRQFTKISLTKTNEPLVWNANDEIGLLVREYNRMLRKLENMTAMLTRDSRETAWREMAKQVAHEIKNPLTPMKLSLQMLERAIKTNAENVQDIALRVSVNLVEQIDHLSHIASSFSDLAKLPVANKEVLYLNDVLYSVTGMFNDNSYTEFLFIIPDYPIPVYADKSQLIRVFTNILQNAIQSIPEDRKGNISLTVRKIRNNMIRVSISDNGEGIPEERSARLFEPYFTTKSSGTGIGLPMCKDIIDEMGGRISFQSTVGTGSEFFIDLPVYIEPDRTIDTEEDVAESN